jgi:hypothetical protein
MRTLLEHAARVINESEVTDGRTTDSEQAEENLNRQESEYEPGGNTLPSQAT